MGNIKKILENELMGGTQSTDVYPVTSTKAVYDENNERLDKILSASDEKLTKLEQEQIQGGIYDVSAHNNGAVFESLSALLSSTDLSTLIPTSVRHGGMSIRFVQSSDNKYVQYRLMSDAWSLNVSDWQGVDDEPIKGSKNLVKSGGVSKEFSNIEKQLSVLKKNRLVSVSSVDTLSIDNDNKTFSIASFLFDEKEYIPKSLSFGTLILSRSTNILVYNTVSGSLEVRAAYNEKELSEYDVVLCIFRAANTSSSAPYQYKVTTVLYSFVPYKIIEDGVVVERDSNAYKDSIFYKGIATPSTNPGTPEYKTVYLAMQVGNYVNFGNITVNNGLSILSWDGTWTKSVIFEIADRVEDNQKLINGNLLCGEKGFRNIDLSLIKEDLGSIGETNWYGAHSSMRHKVIPAHAGDKFKLQSRNGAIFAWLTDAYTPPVASGDAKPIPFVRGTKRIVLTSTDSVEVIAPESTAYLCVNTVGGDTQKYSWIIQLLSYNSLINESAVKVNEEIHKHLQYTPINVSMIYNYLGCLASSSTWYGAHSSMRHKVIPVTHGDRFNIKPSSNSATAVRYGWLTGNYIPPIFTTEKQTVPFVDGTKAIYTNIGEIANIVAPQGAAYLCLNTVDGAENTITWEVEKLPADSILDCIQKELVPLINRISNIDLIGVENIQFYDANSIINKSKMKFDRYSNADMPSYKDDKASQARAISGNYMFLFRNTGIVDYYSINDNKVEFTYIGQFSLASLGNDNHCNAAQFDNKIIEGSFPYLYVSACTTNNFKCFVECITLDNNVMTSILKQTITLGNEIISSLNFETHACNITQDNKYLYAIFSNTLYASQIAIIKLNRPSIETGDITLGLSDVIDTWYYDVDDFVIQGSKVYGRHLYLSHGGTYNFEVIHKTRGLNVYNTLTGELEMRFDLEPFSHEEIEDVELYDDKIFIFTLGTNYYAMSLGTGAN